MDTKNEALGDNQGHNQSLGADGKTDSSLAIEHIKLLHRAAQGLDGKLVLCSYGQNPETGKDITPKVQQFDIGNWQGMASTAATWAKETHRNVYAPLAVLKQGISSRGKMPDYSHVLGVCADFDDDNAADYLNRLPLSPGMVIGSSKGRFQCVFLFNSPIDTNAAKPIAEALQAHAGCDGCSKDVIHVWRVPGCLNWPNQKKVREGRSPEPQQVTIVQDWCGKAIDADALLSSMPPVEHKPKKPAAAILQTHNYPEATRDEVKEALSFISPDLPYDEWVNALAALHDAGCDDLAHEWSSRSTRYDPAEVDGKLESFTGGGITIATVFHYAKEGGYSPSRKSGMTKLPGTESMDATIDRLAKLSALEYDKVRKDEARTLDVRLSTLDATVTDRRKAAQQQDSMFEDVEPWPYKVNGGELLNDIAALFRRYVILPLYADIAAALWVLNTYVHDASFHSPMVHITAPDKACGKTRFLDVLEVVVCKPLSTSNLTGAATFRAIELWHPTFLFDEVDTSLKDNDELAGIINSGHTKTKAYVMRCVGDDFEPARFSTWCPKVLCGIGTLRGTTESRCITISMRRKLPDEKVQRFRTGHADFADIQQRCSRWAEDNFHAVKASDLPDVEGLEDRDNDNWLGLRAIAALCDWQDKATLAALALSGAGDSESIDTTLLADIRDIFERVGIDRIASQKLCIHLVEIEDRPWSEWCRGRPITTNKLAGRLKSFGIHSKTMRLPDGGMQKGYALESFKDAFARYIPDSKRNNVTSEGAQGLQPISKRNKKENVTFQKTLEPLGHNDCYGVTLQNTESPDSTENGQQPDTEPAKIDSGRVREAF